MRSKSWYQSTCDDNSLVTFNLSVDVGDQTIINTDQESQLASRYMITFTVNQGRHCDGRPRWLLQHGIRQHLELSKRA